MLISICTRDWRDDLLFYGQFYPSETILDYHDHGHGQVLESNGRPITYQSVGSI